jgi:anti-sigma factor RsiW
MMTEHLTEQIIELYRRREIDPVARQRTDAHLAQCDVCLARVADPQQSALAFNALTEAFLPSNAEQSFHLSPAELKAYVSGAAGEPDRVICESHFEICAQCSEERRLLSTVRVPDQAKAKPRLHKWWPASISFTPARAAAAIALLGIVVLAIVLWRQRSTRDESARSRPTETPLVLSSPAPANEVTPNAGEQPGVSNPPMLVRLIDNNREIRLNQDGKLTGLDEFDESAQRMARAALAGENLTKPGVLNDLRSPPINLLGGPSSDSVFELISPLGRVVSEQRPTLSWQRLSGAADYVVSVFDANFNRVVQSPRLSKPVWILSTPLPRGQTYSWEVTAVKDDKEITAPIAPAPRAQFRIIEADKLNALTKLKGQKPVSHLALGLMYARFGLIDDAEKEFRRLVKENPDSEAAKKLLHTVQAWRTR